MTKIMCTQYIDPSTMASRLIPLDKVEGAVRPIGVGEVLRTILAKCVMNVAKEDVAHASGSLQLCAGQKSGSEAAMLAMHAIFEADETDGILLIHATNAFNSLNRAASLHNIHSLCPIISAFAINTYRNNCIARRPNHVSTTSIARRFSREIGKTNFQAKERGRSQRKSEKRLWEGTS